MSFIIFEKEQQLSGLIYKNTHEYFSLAGWNLLYKCWDNRGKPINVGWSLEPQELLQTLNPLYSDQTHALIIDFHPSSKDRIGLVEIERIHLFTFGNEGKAGWTPIMLELRDIYYEEDIENFTIELKHQTTSNVTIGENRSRMIEFLYLNGDSQQWKWGKNGMTNAAFIHDGPRKYFQQFFMI